jgi:hypothetical protein
MKKASYPTQHDEFLMWVGFCITAWARVEEQLFKICEACIQARRDRVAIVYYLSPSINTRLKLVDELVRTVLPKREKTSGAHDHSDLVLWDTLRKDIGALLGTRRRIAHHPVRARSGHSEDRPFWFLEESSWLEIYESETERLRTGHDTAKPLKQDDLVDHVRDVHAVGTRAANFCRSVLPKHAE